MTQPDIASALENAIATEPEVFALDSGGTISIAKCFIRFKPWTGKPIANTYGGKAVLDSDREPVFAELAILRLLQKHGFDGVWVDSYRLKFLKSLSVECALPDHAQAIYDRIVAANGGRHGGCWDVLAWKQDQFVFIESKQKSKGYKDSITDTQKRWLQAALKIGFDSACFLICEWDFQPVSEGMI